MGKGRVDVGGEGFSISGFSFRKTVGLIHLLTQVSPQLRGDEEEEEQVGF